jgi:hypothetical protein
METYEQMIIRVVMSSFFMAMGNVGFLVLASRPKVSHAGLVLSTAKMSTHAG